MYLTTIPFFSQLKAKFKCLAGIDDIYLFDRVRFKQFDKEYTGIITDVATTGVLEEVEIEDAIGLLKCGSLLCEYAKPHQPINILIVILQY